LELGADADYVQSIRDEIVEVLQLASDDGKGILTALSPDGDRFRPQEGSAIPRSRATRAAERRLLTFLFCDVVSSTPLSTRLDPEDLRELMLKYQSVCSTAIERFDGHISQWVGDGASMYFGFPEAHDDDAVRAVHAALAMVEAVSGIPAAADGTKLAVRVGVHTGWAVVGDQGGRGQNETLAFGEAPNICARIQACAEPNTVAVSESTFALAKGFFVFRDLGEFDLKGVDRAVRLYRAGASTGAGVRFDVVRDQGLMPLVDRVRERELLSAGWRACQIGDGPALLIEGEAGIGKSRIVHFVRLLVLKPAQILELCASPYQRWSSSRAVTDAFRKFWGLDKLAEGDRLKAIASRLEALQFDDPLALPLVADLLDVRRPESAELTKMAPPQIRSLTFETMCNLVRRSSETAPLLVIVEDMHWLDPSSDELVRLML
jgi:class 3 adenylate cyclase